jgi:SAM-dependent methyltransferase
MTVNRLLTDTDRLSLKHVIDKMFIICPDMMSRKIFRANVQQAFMLDTISKEVGKGLEIGDVSESKILSVGCFEDTAYEVLHRYGLSVTGIDPDVNFYLHEFVRIVGGEYNQSYPDKYDVIFSTSVIEHVPDDEQFMEDICLLLKPGGLGILTCDYNNNYKAGDLLPYSDLRFYTENDLKFRLGKIIHKHDCEFVDTPDWTGEPDFSHDGCNYSFATFAFRKNN